MASYLTWLTWALLLVALCSFPTPAHSQRRHGFRFRRPGGRGRQPPRRQGTTHPAFFISGGQNANNPSSGVLLSDPSSNFNNAPSIVFGRPTFSFDYFDYFG
ncbi:uncharacterized protein [Cherax quadricarinatus]|uniref:uncharacterized protein isoform X1 n=1 Tax=Cherax quadricarinatus TaxID=27406 RepID=UPI00387E54FB